MNERIKELSDKCGLAWTLKTEQDVKNLVEFAELIVQECADIAKKEQEYNDSHSIHVNIDYCIKHHFGVE